MTTFREVLKQRRLKNKLRQYQLAQLIGMSPSYLCDIELGNRSEPSNQFIKRIACELEIDFDYLMYLAGRIPEDIIRMQLSEYEVKVLFGEMRTVADICSRG